MPPDDLVLDAARKFLAAPSAGSPAESDPNPDVLNSAREVIGLPPGGEFPKRILGEIGPGFGAGVEGLGTSFTALRAVFNDVTGDEEETNRLIQEVIRREQETQRKYPRTVEKVEDIDSVGDFARFAVRGVGETLPAIGSVIAGGGAGGIAANLAAKKATQEATKQAIKRIGQTSGAYVTATGIETGFTASEQAGALGEVKPAVALTAGAIKGALESIAPTAIASRFGIGMI